MSNFEPIIHPWNQEVWQNLTSESERANHALLFCGDDGLGKCDLAFSLAFSVLTTEHSQSVNLFNAGSHPDCHVIMPECEIEEGIVGDFARRYIEPHSGKPKKTITIDQVRKLSQTLTTHPHIGSHRVILIFFAETMNRNAANALLKSLEEPPANTLFLIVSDEVSKIAKTIRSRCSVVNVKAPDFEVAKAWVNEQGVVTQDQIDTHLAMANNHPLKAQRLYQENYLTSLKAIFTDVNGLWTQRAEVTKVAKQWQELSSVTVIDILQKMMTDLLRCQLSDKPATVFFPVQLSWLQTTSAKLSRERLLDVIDALNYAKQMLATTVDELLVLETVSNKVKGLPL